MNSLKRRRDCIHRLCSALEEFLADGLDESIARCAVPPRRPFVTIEMLVDAQTKRVTLQDQLDTVQRLVDELPEALGGIPESAPIAAT